MSHDLHGPIGLAFGMIQELLCEPTPLQPFAEDATGGPLTVEDGKSCCSLQFRRAQSSCALA